MKILLVRLRELGDTLLVTPLLRQLKRLYPGGEIDVLCQHSNLPVLEHNDHVSRCFILPPRASAGSFLSIAGQLRRNRYSLVIDSQSLPKTAIMARLTGARMRLGLLKPGWRNRLCYTHPCRVPIDEYTARSNLRLLQDDRVDLDDVGLDFPVSDETESLADAFVRRYLRPPVAAIFGVSRFAGRVWPVEKTAEVGDRLASLGLQPWLVYGPGQAEAARAIADRMKRPALHEYEMPSFATLHAILRRCALFFGNDGGPKHAAVAAGIPTVTLYHARQASAWAPPSTPRHRVACTRPYPGMARPAGAFTFSESIAEIPADAVWKEIATALRQPAAFDHRPTLTLRRAA
jgi:ADP-heptose:LPS heptosyltransferase